jgi:hypothetical protein
MKILFLCTYYRRAMIFHDLAKNLKVIGHEVNIFNAVARKAKIYDKYKDIMNYKIPLIKSFITIGICSCII